MGGSHLWPRERERERLCGCSHVYVWEISNDERMPFQVGTGGASFKCPTLLPCTSTAHMRSSWRARSLARAYIRWHIRSVCNFIIRCCTLCSVATMVTTSKDFSDTASRSMPDTDSVVSLGPGSQSHYTYTDTSPSSILFPSSLNPSERASLFYSVCIWAPFIRTFVLAATVYAWPTLVFLHLVSLWCCGL